MIIYKTKNKINNKCYVGQSKVNNNNYIGSGLLLKRAIEKYGKENFEKEILIEFDFYNKELLNESEKYWINFYSTIENGYNLSKGGNGGWDYCCSLPRTEKQLESSIRCIRLAHNKPPTRKQILARKKNAKRMGLSSKTEKQLNALKENGFKMGKLNMHNRWHEGKYENCEKCKGRNNADT